MILYNPFESHGRQHKTVNLSWMLRYPNYGLITKLFVTVSQDSKYPYYVRGTLLDGRSIHFSFADQDVLENFLFTQHKRILDGVAVDWMGTNRSIKA